MRDYKALRITQVEIDALNVKSTPGSRLTGTVRDNKNVFDRLAEFLAARINAVLSELSESGAADISLGEIEGYVSETVQGAFAEVAGRITELQNGKEPKSVTLTWAAYNALSEAERLSGKVFYVTDGPEETVRIDAFRFVDALPSVGDPGFVYFVPKAGSEGVFEGSVWVAGVWRRYADISVSISNFYTKEETDARLAEQLVWLSGSHFDKTPEGAGGVHGINYGNGRLRVGGKCLSAEFAFTAPALGWTDFTRRVVCADVRPDSAAILTVQKTASDNQIAAAASARLSAEAGDGYFDLTYASAEAPEIDLPLSLLIVG